MKNLRFDVFKNLKFDGTHMTPEWYYILSKILMPLPTTNNDDNKLINITTSWKNKSRKNSRQNKNFRIKYLCNLVEAFYNSN